MSAAVQLKHHDMVVSLIAAGANVDNVTDQGMTPLHIAAIEGDSAMVRELLQAGADPTIKRERFFGLVSDSVVDAARRHGHEHIIQILTSWPDHVQEGCTEN